MWFSMLALGGEVVSWMEQTKEWRNEPRCLSWFVLVMHWVGLPLPGSPLIYLPLSISPCLSPSPTHLPLLSCPHPSGKGRGRCSRVCISECAAFLFAPTSLKRGEGLVSGHLHMDQGGKGKGSGRRMSGGWMNINCDGVDVSFKLCSSTKIALDICILLFDKKKKSSIIL